MSSSNQFTYSVICASKNEEEDIHHLLDSFKNIKDPNSELIIIDDSTDGTKKIIEDYSFKDNRIKLINGENKGCCEARNFGINNSKGDIIIFMTADSFFSFDLTEKIDKYYSQGYDAVMLNSRVSNLESPYANFIYCSHLKKLEKKVNFSPLTTQGYSVKKSSALDVGLIESGNYKPNVCRDWTLIKKMDKKNYKKIFLKNLRCDHIAPDNHKVFFNTHYARGQMSSGYSYFFLKNSKFKIILKSFLKGILYFIYFATLFQWFENNINLLKHNNQKNSNLFKFLYLDIVKRTAFLYGEFISTFKFKK